MAETFNAASWSASELLTSVYRACRLPESGTIDYDPTTVLTMADEAIHVWAGQLLASARDGRAVTTTLRALTTDSEDTAGRLYRLPPMSIGNTIEAVKWADDDDEQNVCSLQTIPAGMESSFDRWTDSGTPTCYALIGEQLKVFPRPFQRGTLRITYMRRHGQLVIGSDTTTVVSVLSTVDPDTLEIETSAVPSSFVSNAWVDVYGPYYPYPLKQSGRIVAGGVSPNILIAADYDEWNASVDPGDTLVIYGKTPYVSLPLEMKGPLVQQVARQIVAELGDKELSAGFDAFSREGAAKVADMFSPRAKSDKQKLVNPFSVGRGASYYGRRRFWGGRGG